ncbi:hypothetical protein PRZ48_001973 [Zasmidium cellare]|uniref:F-box domain-containing protein n=1 Tax=Zasmidium cellare TaxID=395010 RepID=A0ABR0F3F1_ZASCE|nr:hypothetical protein PRZ48_001973 [Zasmidium cellare]
MGRRKSRWHSIATTSTSDAKMDDSPRVWQMSSTSKTDHASTKKGVARARAKHQIDNLQPPEPPSLADRFHALPVELRAHVFSLLLVQPVKWDMLHQATCILRDCDFDQTPHPPWDSGCASCNGCDTRLWRRDVQLGLETWQNPWRSVWAPPRRNPYLCTQCYDTFHRPKTIPRPESLPCLCARRQNLDVLLVCKKWYHEAATVFYTRNTFAFETPSTFVPFITTLPSQWRAKISKISLMAFHPLSPGSIDVDSGYPANTPIFPKRWVGVYPLLRNELPALTSLELDSRLLKNPKTVKALLQLRLHNVRRISFVERPQHTRQLNSLWTNGTDKIWPAMACRTLIVGGFAEDTAKAMKTDGVRVLKGAKGKRIMARAVEISTTPGEGIFESALFEELGFTRTERRQVCAADEDEGYDEDHFGLLGLHDS